MDASAASFPAAAPAWRPGVRVEVEGSLRGGVLRARAVDVKSDEDMHERGFELSGAHHGRQPGGRAASWCAA